jgi:hypothetical protein
MKILSIIVTVLLFGVTFFTFDAVWAGYALNDKKLLNKEVLFSIEKALLINGGIFLIFFCTSLFLTIKKKYKANIIVLFGGFIVYLVISTMIVQNG